MEEGLKNVSRRGAEGKEFVIPVKTGIHRLRMVQAAAKTACPHPPSGHLRSSAFMDLLSALDTKASMLVARLEFMEIF